MSRTPTRGKVLSVRWMTCLGLCWLMGCTATVDRFSVDRVVTRALTVADVGQVCALGSSLAHVLAAATDRERPPHLALVVAEATSGLCPQAEAWEIELRRLRLAPTDAAAITDAKLTEQRLHALAGARFFRAWQHTEAAFGTLGEQCPRIDADDEIIWLVGHLSGMLAVLHDRASGGVNDVPLDVIGKVGRSIGCIDDARWWHMPSALKAAAWATIPGSGPKDVNPWEAMHRAARQGETSGVRLAWAVLALIAANADRHDELLAAIKGHAVALSHVPASQTDALLDEYARLVTLHQSDVVWTQARQHRTPVFGALPGDAPLVVPVAPSEDPFQ